MTSVTTTPIIHRGDDVNIDNRNDRIDNSRRDQIENNNTNNETNIDNENNNDKYENNNDKDENNNNKHKDSYDKVMGVTDDVTAVTENVTDVTENVTDVTENVTENRNLRPRKFMFLTNKNTTKRVDHSTEKYVEKLIELGNNGKTMVNNGQNNGNNNGITQQHTDAGNDDQSLTADDNVGKRPINIADVAVNDDEIHFNDEINKTNDEINIKFNRRLSITDSLPPTTSIFIPNRGPGMMKHADYVSDSDNSAKIRGMIATAKRALKLRQMYAMFGKTSTNTPIFSSEARIKGKKSAHQERPYPAAKRRRVDEWKSRTEMEIDIPSDDSSIESEFSDNDVPELSNRYSDDTSDSSTVWCRHSTLKRSMNRTRTLQQQRTSLNTSVMVIRYLSIANTVTTME